MESYLEHILKQLPADPGVYKMKNADGKIIYIGKAKNLKKRVTSYFQRQKDHGMRTRKMVEHIRDIEYTVASSELEALILETNLIKEFRPKYNILMKDDKSFAYIKVTINEDYPRILITRKVLNDGARYFGPKTSAGLIKKTLKVLRNIFPYRNCSLEITHNSDTNEFDRKSKVTVTHASIQFPCLDFHIKRCIAPCIGKPAKEEYTEIINQIIRFLEGKHQEVMDRLKEQMMKAATEKRFEAAAKIRNKILDVESIVQNQLVSDPDQKDTDVINFFPDGNAVYFNLFQIREGNLIDQQNLTLKVSDLEEEKGTSGNTVTEKELKNVLVSFLQQYYITATDIPFEILVPLKLKKADILSEWLTTLRADSRGKKVRIVAPERGKNNKLLELCLKNAESFAKQSKTRWEGKLIPQRAEALERLKNLLKLKKLPKRLECYDISHFAGTETVGSMTVFENGFPKNSDYRHFKLHHEENGKPDDFASMEEVLTRRLKYLKPAMKVAEIKVKRIKKSSTEEETEHFYETFFDKELVAKFSMKSLKNKRCLLEIEIHKPEKFEDSFRKIVEKCEFNRIYLFTTEDKKDVFFDHGFQEVKKIPDDISLQSNETLLVFQKIKHKSDPSFKKVPDLLIIDGGKGQLSSAMKALKKFDLDLPIMSIAKREEEFFTPQSNISIKLEPNDPIRLMVQHIRDEAHRFAITHQKNLRAKVMTHSALDDIFGVGETIRKDLLRKFGSVEDIKNASLEEIATITGAKLAAKIKEKLSQ